MTRTLGNKLAALIGAVSLLLILLFSSLSVSLGAQTTSDGSYLMYRVNLVGTPPMMNKNGQSTSSGDLQTLDGRMSLKIPLGTIIHNAAGKNQEFISALLTQPTSLPGQTKSVIAYELGTPGATFNPTVGLTFNYSDSELQAASISESSLYVAQWNGSSWVKITSDVNTSFNTVSTTIVNFTQYALLGSTAPATTTITAQPTSAPPTTTPTTSASNPLTATQWPSTPGSSVSGGISPIVFVIGVGAVILLIVLLVVSRKK